MSNDRLGGAIAARDQRQIVERLPGALQTCIELPKRKVEFDGTA